MQQSSLFLDLESLEIPTWAHAHGMCGTLPQRLDLQYTHIRGVDNKVTDALSRWKGTADQWQLLGLHVVHPVWLQVSLDMLELDPEL